MRIAAAAELHKAKWDQIESGGPGSGRHAGFGSGLKKGIGDFAQRITNHLVKGGWKYGGRSGNGTNEHRSFSHPDHGTMHVHGDGSWMHTPKSGGNNSSGRGADSLQQHVKNLGESIKQGYNKGMAKVGSIAYGQPTGFEHGHWSSKVGSHYTSP